MSESSANLETLDNEDIYKQCLCFDETRCGPYTKHFEDGPFKLDDLIKISQGISRIWRYAVLANFFLLHAYQKQKGVDWGCYRWTPSGGPHSVHWGVKPPF